MVGIVQGSFQWTENGIHSIRYSTTEHIHLVEQPIQFVATKRIIDSECEIVDTTHPLAEFHTANDEGVIHQLDIGCAHKG